MTKKQKFLDDVASVAGGAVGIATTAVVNAQADFKNRLHEKLLELDVVPRSEFERLEAMLQKARLEQEELKQRIENLEEKGRKP